MAQEHCAGGQNGDAAAALLTDLSGKRLDAAAMTALLGVGVRSVGVAPESVKLWVQSHSAKVVAELADEARPPLALHLKKVLGCNVAKTLPAMERNLAGSRVEARFYTEFAPELTRRGLHVPRLYHCDERLSALDAEGGDDEQREAALRKSGVLYLMECVDHLEQTSPLSQEQARSTLRALVALHAAAWQDERLLRSAAARLHEHAGYWTLEQRGQAELDRIEDVWGSFVAAFRPVFPELLARPEIAALATRVAKLAPQVSAELAASPGQQFATLVHGDYKAMNVFLPERVGHDPAVLIDFQWVGVGFGMSDVAMHLSHSVDPAALCGGGEERLVELYRELLCEAVGPAAAEAYTPAVAWRHYHLGVVDWGRMVLAAFFKGATPETFERHKDDANRGLAYRSLDACAAFLERLDRALAVLERGGP